MCLSLASPPHRILAHLDVRTTLSKKFTDRNQRPMSCTEEGRAKALARHRKAEAVPLLASVNGQYRHGERTKAAIAEQRKFTAVLKNRQRDVTTQLVVGDSKNTTTLARSSADMSPPSGFMLLPGTT